MARGTKHYKGRHWNQLHKDYSNNAQVTAFTMIVAEENKKLKSFCDSKILRVMKTMRSSHSQAAPIIEGEDNGEDNFDDNDDSDDDPVAEPLTPLRALQSEEEAADKLDLERVSPISENMSKDRPQPIQTNT